MQQRDETLAVAYIAELHLDRPALDLTPHQGHCQGRSLRRSEADMSASPGRGFGQSAHPEA